MDDLNKRAQEDINRILAEVDAAKQTTPQARSEPVTPESDQAELPTRLIDIHVYDLPEGEKPALNDQQPQATNVPPAAPPRPRRRRARLLLIGGLCILLLVSLAILVVSPLMTAEATVTIIPVTRAINATSTMMVVTGQPATGAEQVSGSQLSPVSMSGSQTVSTTGKGHQDARPGHGPITFYNAAPYTQTVTAGMLLTSANGIQVVTEQDAVIPGAVMPTEGQATVSAHTLQTGPAGNIRAGAVYGACCRVNVFVANGAFHGGQTARDFPTVTATDITTAAAHLKSSLDQSIQAALSAQIAANQTLITPLSCRVSTTPNHRVGEEATQVRVTVSETCTAATYNTERLQHLIKEQISQQARVQTGKGYAPTGMIQSHIIKVTPEGHGHIILQVSSTASYAYQFTQAQQQTIKSMIAGKSKAQATNILLQVAGVQSVSMSLSYGDQLPTDPNKIHLVFLVTS